MEEHALNGEYISVLRNGVLSYGGSSDGWTAGRCANAAAALLRRRTCCCICGSSGRTAGG